MVDLRVLRVCYACPRLLDGVKVAHCVAVGGRREPRWLDGVENARVSPGIAYGRCYGTCATIATLRRPSSVDAAMRSGWLVRSCLAPARSGPLATSARAAANITMQAAVLFIGLYRWRSCKKRGANSFAVVLCKCFGLLNPSTQAAVQ